MKETQKIEHSFRGDRPAWRRSLRVVTVATALTLPIGAVVAACSSADSSKPGAASPLGERQTDLEHEACDGESSSARKTDVNGDQKPDIIHVMDGNREACRIVDLNLDGAVDAFIYYDEQGRERRRESDFDRDGRPDEIAIFQGGALVRKERETNFDDKLDTWDYYEGGRLVRRERDSDGDKIVDQWWQFNNPTNPKCALVASDRNADGKPDPGSVVDLCNEEQPTATSEPDAGADAATDARGADEAIADAGATPAPEPTSAAITTADGGKLVAAPTATPSGSAPPSAAKKKP